MLTLWPSRSAAVAPCLGAPSVACRPLVPPWEEEESEEALEPAVTPVGVSESITSPQQHSEAWSAAEISQLEPFAAYEPGPVQLSGAQSLPGAVVSATSVAISASAAMSVEDEANNSDLSDIEVLGPGSGHGAAASSGLAPAACSSTFNRESAAGAWEHMPRQSWWDMSRHSWWSTDGDDRWRWEEAKGDVPGHPEGMAPQELVDAAQTIAWQQRQGIRAGNDRFKQPLRSMEQRRLMPNFKEPEIPRDQCNHINRLIDLLWLYLRAGVWGDKPDLFRERFRYRDKQQFRAKSKMVIRFWQEFCKVAGPLPSDPQQQQYWMRADACNEVLIRELRLMSAGRRTYWPHTDREGKRTMVPVSVTDFRLTEQEVTEIARTITMAFQLSLLDADSDDLPSAGELRGHLKCALASGWHPHHRQVENAEL
jgi:hypothetical protein